MGFWSWLTGEKPDKGPAVPTPAAEEEITFERWFKECCDAAKDYPLWGVSPEEKEPEPEPEPEPTDRASYSDAFEKELTQSIDEMLAEEETPAETEEPEDPDEPEYNEDYAKAIFLWAYGKGIALDDDTYYYAYLRTGCGIRDARAFHVRMIDEGYMEPGVDKKGQQVYIPSAKGRAFIDEHSDYVELHRYKGYNVGLREYTAEHKDGESFVDTVERIHKRRISEGGNDFGRTEFYSLYELYRSHDRERDALKAFLQCLYIDVSGYELADEYHGPRDKKDARMYFDSYIFIIPMTPKVIKKLGGFYDKAMLDEIYEYELPVQVCGKKIFDSIVKSAIDGTYDQDKALQKVRRAYNKYVNEVLFPEE
ncbi:MAG: hypothetical protein J6U98_07550 [Abditibacteriota bacterium]|nr:hypothetical protein [Abditibacteriota bacterium]